MRSLPALVTTEVAKEAHFQRHLFKLVATTTYRWTDCDQQIYFDGNYWEPYGITYADLSYAIDQAVITGQLTIPNADKVFSDLSLSEDLRGKAFTIYRVWLNNALTVIGATVESDPTLVNPDLSNQIAFCGLVDSIPSAHRRDAQVNLVSLGIGGNVICPRRVFEPKCPWVNIGGFKGTYCAYPVGSAGTWCDGSKARCVALGNQLNFGGWESISDLMSQEVYWGRHVKSWGKK